MNLTKVEKTKITEIVSLCMPTPTRGERRGQIFRTSHRLTITTSNFQIAERACREHLFDIAHIILFGVYDEYLMNDIKYYSMEGFFTANKTFPTLRELLQIPITSYESRFMLKWIEEEPPSFEILSELYWEVPKKGDPA